MFSDKSKFLRYLAAKVTVDERALNERVWRSFVTEAANLDSTDDTPVQIVDLGAGIGSGVLRLAERDPVLSSLLPCSITLVDRDEAVLHTARDRIRTRLPGLRDLRLCTMDVVAFANQAEERGRYHLVLAQALLDMTELESALDGLIALARPGGVGYYPICFDGLSVFEPAHALDSEILDAFHASMESIEYPGEHPGEHPSHGNERAHTGRRLLRLLQEKSVDLVAVGSSDWIVHPTGGRYPDDEAFFLEAILELLEVALTDVGSVSKANLTNWLGVRRKQLAENELIYLAHQLDFLVRRRTESE